MTTSPDDAAIAAVPAARQVSLETARHVLASLGLSAADLLSQPSPTLVVPTFTVYVPVVSAAVSDGARRCYTNYWNRIVDRWGGRRLDEPVPSEILEFAEYIKANVVRRRNSRGGRVAVEHFIGALRCVYKFAERDGLIKPDANPARKVDKPRRLPSTRHAVPSTGLADINHVAATTGNDPELDTLLLRLHTETACRRGGALNLRPLDLDPKQCLILLREKGETVRWQPVSPTLMRHLQYHVEERRAPRGDQLLRYADATPITTRRYDYLWRRIGLELPWVASQQISTHWLRHTTLTFVERQFGYGVARAYAGHGERGSDVGSTATYIRANRQEVATALAVLTGEPHPLALDDHRLDPPRTAHDGDSTRSRHSEESVR